LLRWCWWLLMTCVDDVLGWCVDDFCWCVGVQMCWWHCVDVLMIVLMYWRVDVLMCWCVVTVLMTVLMCWCVDVLMSRQEKKEKFLFFRLEKTIEVPFFASNFTWIYRKNFGKFFSWKKVYLFRHARQFS